MVLHTSGKLNLCYGKDEGRRSSSLFWFRVWYLIHKQEQSLAKGVEIPRAWIPGHLIAGDSLVPAGKRACCLPSSLLAGHGSLPALALISSSHRAGVPTSCYTSYTIIKSRWWFSDYDKVTLWELRSPSSLHQPHTFHLGKAPTSGCDRSDASRGLRGARFFIGPWNRCGGLGDLIHLVSRGRRSER